MQPVSSARLSRSLRFRPVRSSRWPTIIRRTRSPCWSAFRPAARPTRWARILADAMGRALGQTVVVETVSGASGTIATGRVVHAAPDGYTIGIGNWTSHVGSPALYSLDYDILNDLQPISLLASSPLWIVGKNALPPKSATELVAWVKSNHNPITFGNGRRRQRGASMRSLFCAENRRPFSIRAVSRRRAGDAGSDRRPDRSVLPRGLADARQCAGRTIQGLRRHGRTALAEIAGHADHDRIRRAGPFDLVLARAMDDEGNAQAHRRSPRQGGHDRACRSGGALRASRISAR